MRNIDAPSREVVAVLLRYGQILVQLLYLHMSRQCVPESRPLLLPVRDGRLIVSRSVDAGEGRYRRSLTRARHSLLCSVPSQCASN